MCADPIVGYSIHVFARFYLDIMEQIETGIIWDVQTYAQLCEIFFFDMSVFSYSIYSRMTFYLSHFVDHFLSHGCYFSKVRVLMLSGAFTSSLRRAYDSGEDIRGAGILNLRWKAPNMVENSG